MDERLGKLQRTCGVWTVWVKGVGTERGSRSHDLRVTYHVEGGSRTREWGTYVSVHPGDTGDL